MGNTSTKTYEAALKKAKQVGEPFWVSEIPERFRYWQPGKKAWNHKNLLDLGVTPLGIAMTSNIEARNKTTLFKSVPLVLKPGLAIKHGSFAQGTREQIRVYLYPGQLDVAADLDLLFDYLEKKYKVKMARVIRLIVQNIKTKDIVDFEEYSPNGIHGLFTWQINDQWCFCYTQKQILAALGRFADKPTQCELGWKAPELVPGCPEIVKEQLRKFKKV